MSSEQKRVDISAMEPATATVAVDTSNQLYRSYLTETQNSGGTQIPVLEAETVSVEDVMRMREAEEIRKPVVLVDKCIEGLSRRRDDYYPASLARDPKPDVTEVEAGLDDETKRRFKKPREVSLVADYIRRFLRTENYNLNIPLKDQLHVVEVLKRKLQIVFPAGEWETSIVKALIREKTKKKRMSSIGSAPSLGAMSPGQANNLSPSSSKMKKSGTPVCKRQRLESKPAWALQLEQQIIANTSAIQNDRTRGLNVGGELQPLLKERTGLHLLTGLVPEELQPTFEASVVVPSVGSEPDRDLFPRTEVALRSLSHHQILRLIEFYNDNMGIVSSDDIETRRRKLSSWARK